MMVRLLLGVTFVANIVVLVVCPETSQVTATSISSSSATSSSSYASSSSSAKAVGKSKPKCRRVMKCPPNEEFSFCPESIQRAQYCSEKAEPSTLRSTAGKPCKKGCVCKENYLRAANGTCIPTEQCPITCGANEVLDNCPEDCQSDYCPTEEDTEAKPCVTPDVCPPPACKCAFNHRRASNGSCIPTKECPPFKCGTNEEYNPCPPLCPTDDCSQASPTGVCPPQFGHIGIILPCNPKCRCIKDYWRLDGICVPYGQCPGVCPANERYSTCIQAECRALNCTQKDQSVPCIRLDPKYCEKGCVCEEGYLRNQDGICVLEDKCETKPFCNSTNEEFVPCMQGVCRAKDCSQKGEDVPCPDIPAEECDSGCICKEHFLRAANGSCVPEDQCEPPKTCGENEVLDNCSMTCTSDYCPRSADEEQVCKQSDPCVPACKCQFNYRRAENGTCIPTRDCPPFDCSAKPNEKYDPCPPICPTDECGTPRLEGRCPFRIGIILQCNPKCQCMDGYGRSNGTCVPFEECPDLCPANEVYSSCVQQTCRPQNCSERDVAMETCPKCDADSCQRGCVCKDNYYRNDKGVCVSYEECGVPKTCGENEILDNCSTTCNSDYCPRSDDEEQVCKQSDPCLPACKCKFNYRRAENGTCIPARDCPPFDCSAKPNEKYDPCPPICPTDECGTPRLEGRCPFKIGIILQCNPKCQCIDGYGRSNGTCVPFEECPDLCPINEVYSPCVQKTCRPQNCSDRDVAMETCPTCDAASCQRGCVCQKNYYRNDKGVCVSYEECGVPKTCGENEVLDNCSMTCTSDYCPRSDDEEQVCKKSDPCAPACKCKFNYRRAENGTCIPTRDCPPFDCSAKPNEKYDPCPPICPTDECGTPRLEGRCPFKIGIILQCNPKCQCMDGYGRSNGTCVPFEECPDLCPINEVYSSCVQKTCRPQNCSDRDVAMETCPTCDAASCQRGCVCQKNYYRNDKGVCVSYEECGVPKTCGENEILDNCSMTCTSDYCPRSADEEQVCKKSDPCVPACKCKFNYRRAENGTCIPTRDCPPFDCSAKPNEKYDPCPPICPTDECGTPRLEGRCPFKIGIILQCNPKCQCMDGYGRSNGTCVPFEECPDLCPTNEVYSSCVQKTCRPQNCSDRDVAMETCPTCDAASCQRGCVCQKNYYRNDKGVCVSYEECGVPKTCGENEILDNCSMTCTSDYCPRSADEEQVCKKSDPCVPACKCKFNYRRAENGTCIPTRDCPPFDCSAKPNEKYDPCPPICPTDECGTPRIEGRCPFKIGIILQCNPKCQCMEGYGRSNGTCVPFEECPDLCPTNEVYSSCVQKTCRPQNCSDRDVAMETCPTCDAASCQRGCVCQKNYYRNDKGVCVSYEECGVPKTCGENEILDNCSMTCTSDYCPRSADEEQVCKKSDPCVPACKCKFNYRRAENGTCIPTRDCPPFDCSAKPNEKYDPCPPICPTDECGTPRIEGRCPFKIGIILQCNPKCQCMEGYGRSNGTCVPFEECPDLCPTNEVYSSCVQKTCRPQNCSDRDVAMETCPTCDAASCQRGCVCQKNYYRNDKGVCVSYEECGVPKTCGENEILDNCSMTCTSDYCPRSADEEQVCKKSDPCVPACKCKFNYRRAENGTCIPTRDCPPFDCSAKPNEKYDPCPPICPTDECGTPRLEGRCPFKIGIILQCNPKCQCMDGYGRSNGTCVPFEECPDLCPTNEVYSSCVQKTCRPQNCSDRDVAMETCPTCDAASCQRGCVCQKNYYRNDKGVCVSYEECGGPMCPNAHEVYVPNFKECPPNICKSLVAKYACDENQKEGPGCMCESGYLRINVTSPCIPICECPEMKNSPDC